MTKEITKEGEEKDKPAALYKEKSKRRRLNPLIRYLIIASWGVTVAVTISYLLNDLGY